MRSVVLFAMIFPVAMGACATSPASPATEQSQRAATSAEPPLESMKLATRSEKIGAPVDVRYQLTGNAAANQPLTLEIAIVPRVAGSLLSVEIPATASVTMERSGTILSVQKASASTVFRERLMLTPKSDTPAPVRLIVSMDVEGGRFFSIFSIPLHEAPRSDKSSTSKSPSAQMQ